MRYYLILLFLTILISGCVNETRTIPESIVLNQNFTLIKVNPDKNRFAVAHTIYDDMIAYKYDRNYYSYMIDSKKTSKITEETYNNISKKYIDYKYGDFILNNTQISYVNEQGETILQTDAFRYASGKDYLIWSVNQFKSDKIYIMMKTGKQVNEINFTLDPELKVFELAIYQNKIIIQTIKCIYIYNIDTSEQTKIVCDNNIMTRMHVFDNKIVFGGNSQGIPIGGYRDTGIFLVTI